MPLALVNTTAQGGSNGDGSSPVKKPTQKKTIEQVFFINLTPSADLPKKVSVGTHSVNIIE
jgi:hypothetical protein